MTIKMAKKEEKDEKALQPRKWEFQQISAEKKSLMRGKFQQNY